MNTSKNYKSIYKELGGYIEFEYYNKKEYHQNAIPLNCGRNCLAYLIESLGIQKLYLPFFLCDSVKELCKKLNVKVDFYNIDSQFNPIFEKELNKDEYIYIVNYYGQLSNKKQFELSKKYKNIIIDNAQSFFQKPVKSLLTMYTCRKFFGVTDGAYLYTNVFLNRDIEQDISYERMEFLFGRLEKSANEFYTKYSKNNELFKNEPIKQMSKVTQNILRSIDYRRLKKIRTNNYKFLSSKLEKYNQLKLQNPIGPFAYPLYVKNGVEIRKKLQEKKIYIPTLWPNVLDDCKESSLEYDMAKNILPLPVDQRYGREDMEIIINEIKKIKEGE